MTEYERGFRSGMRTGFLDGFNASGEGFNGEYPFNDNGKSPVEDPRWIETRDAAIAMRVELLSIATDAPASQPKGVVVPRSELQAIIDSYEMGPEIYPTTEHCLEATIDKLRAMLAAAKEEQQ